MATEGFIVYRLSFLVAGLLKFSMNAGLPQIASSHFPHPRELASVPRSQLAAQSFSLPLSRFLFLP